MHLIRWERRYGIVWNQYAAFQKLYPPDHDEYNVELNPISMTRWKRGRECLFKIEVLEFRTSKSYHFRIESLSRSHSEITSGS